jgi:hypothetical protein
VKWCIHPGCIKTQTGTSPWQADNHRKTMVDAGLVGSMMAPYCDDHQTEKKKSA